MVDRTTANLAASLWLREVANARMHATIDAVPAVRPDEEHRALRSVPAPYRGLVPRDAAPRPPPEIRLIVGLQHPLTIYDTLFGPSVLALSEVVA